MKKETTSDKLKVAFEKKGLGDAKYWKRRSKKNVPGEGVVRLFENVKSGAQVRVVETAAETFQITPVRLQTAFTLAVKGAKHTPAKPLTLADCKEKDQDRLKAAEDLITLYHGDDVVSKTEFAAFAKDMQKRYGKDINDDDQRDELLEILEEKAGERAINHQYLFGIEKLHPGDGEGFYIWTTPLAFFRKQGHTTDQTGYVSPGYGCAMESCFDAYGEKLEEVVMNVLKEGVQWAYTYQRSVDEGSAGTDAEKQAQCEKINMIVECFRRGVPVPSAQNEAAEKKDGNKPKI